MPSSLKSRDARAIKRARANELRRAAKIAAARRQEERDEAIAPAAQRMDVVDAAGEVVRAARLVRDGVTYIRANPLGQIIAGIERGTSPFDVGHIAAAKRLATTWDEVGGGIGIGASDWGSLRSTRGTAPSTPAGHAVLLSQVEQQMELAYVRTRLGPLWACLEAIVLGGMSPTAWGAAVGVERHAASGFLLAALSLLVTIYKESDRTPEQKSRIRTVEIGRIGDGNSRV